MFRKLGVFEMAEFHEECEMNDPLGRDFWLSEKPRQANLSDDKSLDSDSTRKGNGQARVCAIVTRNTPQQMERHLSDER